MPDVVQQNVAHYLPSGGYGYRKLSKTSMILYTKHHIWLVKNKEIEGIDIRYI
jgi:hypothetical protein